MDMKKKIVACLLCMAMAVSTVPMPMVQAAEDNAGIVLYEEGTDTENGEVTAAADEAGSTETKNYTYTKLQGLTISADCGNGKDTPTPDTIVDGDEDSYWHSAWSGDNQPERQSGEVYMSSNNNITLTLSEASAVKKLEYVSKGADKNGTITKCNIYYKTSAADAVFQKVQEDPYTLDFTDNKATIEFTDALSEVKEIKIEVLNTAGDPSNTFISGYGLHIYSDSDTKVESSKISPKAECSSEKGYGLKNLVDDDDSNKSEYHSSWKDSGGTVEENEGFDAVVRPGTTTPTELVSRNNLYINLSESKTVGKLTYLPRQGTVDGVANGRIISANIYVSDLDTEDVSTITDKDWKKVATVNWGNNADKKEATFSPEMAKHIRIEVKHSAGDTEDAFISAAEIEVYEAKEDAGTPAPDENKTEITAPTVSYTAPKAGEYAKAATVGVSAEAAHHAAVADQAANPATLQKADSSVETTVAYDTGIWGFTGRLIAPVDGTNNNKFDIYGTTPMAMRLKVKLPSNSNNVQLIGKMDAQYGVQVNGSTKKVVLYNCVSATEWPEVYYSFDDSFWDTWHDILVVYTGSGMQLYVDGKAGTPTAGRPNAAADYKVTWKQFGTSIFGIGYNAQKTIDKTENGVTLKTLDQIGGKVADIQLYSGTDYTEGLTKDYEAVINMLDSATPNVNITLNPYDVKTTWKAGDKVLAGGAKFDSATAYTATTVFTAHEGFTFAENSKPTVDGANVTISSDGKTMTVTKTFGKTEEITCSCALGDITGVQDQKVELGVADSKSVKLDPKATATTCRVDGHDGTVVYTYKVKSAGNTGATVTTDGTVTVKDAGEAVITITATLSRKGEEALVKTKEVKLTVTSNKATEQEKEELRTQVGEVKEKYSQEQYAEDDYQAMSDAIKNAKDLLNKSTASKAEIEKAKEAITSAAEALDKLKDKYEAEIRKLHTEIGQLNENHYTTESWKKLTDADTAATNLLSGATTPTPKQLKKAATDLRQAIAGLKVQHTYDVTWDWTWNEEKQTYTAAKATLKCKYCDEEQKDLTGIVSSKTKEATCTEAGEITYTASVEFNGNPYTNEKKVTIQATGHTYGEPGWNWEKTEKGYKVTATFKCSKCEEGTEGHQVIVEAAKVEMTGEVAPGCETKGSKTYKATVTFNGESYDNTETEEVAALGHKLTKTAAKAATCTAAGNSEYYTCSECGKYFSDAAGKNEIAKDSWVIKAKGHTITKKETPATADKEGKIEYSCDVCKDYVEKTFVLPKTETSVYMGKTANLISDASKCSITLANAKKYKKYFTLDTKTGKIKTSTKKLSKVKIKKTIPVKVTVDGKAYNVNVKLKIAAPKIKIKRKKIVIGGVSGYRYELQYNIKGATRVKIRVKKMSVLNKKFDANMSKPKSSKSRCYINASSSGLKKLGNKLTFEIVAYYGKNVSQKFIKRI